MATKTRVGSSGQTLIVNKPKKTRQGQGTHSKPRPGRKRSRGQGTH